MSRAPKILACILLSIPIAVFVACSSSSSGGGPDTTCDTGGADGGTCTAGSTTPFVSCLTGSELQTPTVSYKDTIQPIFDQSCAIGGGECHGAPNNPTMTHIFLGLPGDAGPPSASTILSGIVGVAALEDSKMVYVKAGDPANSYLMHKMDDDECQFSSNCPMNVSEDEIGPCGQGMPLGSGILDLDTRNQVRKWIAQGAQNN